MSLAAVLLVASMSLAQSGPSATEEFDRQLAERQLTSAEDAALIRYLKSRTLSAEDAEKLRSFVRQLTDKDATTKQKAQAALIERGASALPLLKSASKDSPEASLHVAEVIQKIEAKRENDLALAVVRLLGNRPIMKDHVATVLLFIPFAADVQVEEAAFRAVGRHVRSKEGIAPELAKALESPEPKLRGAAAYILGRYGRLEDRETARQKLADESPEVRKLATEGLIGRRVTTPLADVANQDAALLTSSNVGVEAKQVLQWIRDRTLSEEGMARLKKTASELGAGDFKTRTKATRDLIKEGNAAIPFVQPYLEDGNAEIRRRANQIIDEIRQGPGPALPAAAIRQTARQGKSPEALRVLLAYLPFIDDPQNVEEAHHALSLLAAADLGSDAILREALSDPLAARRAAASIVLGRIGNKESVDLVRRNLEDKESLVKIRAAQGLIAAHDHDGIESLVDLLPLTPKLISWQVEEELHRLAGEGAPPESLGDLGSEQRKKASAAWQKWAHANAKRIDLRTIGDDSILGLFLVCEHDTPRGTGRVSEFGRDGRIRWSLEGLAGPMDAQMLPNGNVLVAENSANRVVEYDMQKRVVWEHRVPGNPISCQRLANGNTFIGCYNMLVEVTPEKKVVYQHTPAGGFYCFSAQKMTDGAIVCMTAQGMVQEVDSSNGNIKKSFRLPQPGGWGSVTQLPNRKYLAATMASNQVQEMDDTGAISWRVNVQGVFRAMRLPNGNTMAVSMTSRKVTELDREGRVIWEKTMEGRPWSVRHR
jgi:hypothetical protein